VKRILVAGSLKPFIADDDGVFSRDEYVIVYASAEEDILSEHRADRADLIIADFDTPGIGGDRLCYRIRREVDLRAVSIIMVCDGDKDVAERCRTFGANAIVTKPVDPENLLRKMKELLDVHERKNVREIVKVSVTVSSQDGFFFAVSKNLSVSGLLFETNRVLVIGDCIKCSFVLQHPVIIEGEIVRTTRIRGESGDTFEYGVRFHRLDPAAEDEIEGYIRNLRGK
jgi:CheY-like chemotaxis protein